MRAFKARASFFNATARTDDGFVGLPFRKRVKEPALALPAHDEPEISNQ
jgi:hypothetical protein